jgi:hypothetical protein
MKEVQKRLVKGLIPDRLALYHCMQRNGYYLPAFKSQICSVDYMLKVKKGLIWVPRYKDLRLAPCPLPPSKKDFVTEVFHHIANL